LLEMIFGNARMTDNTYCRADGKLLGSVCVSAQKIG
jgi:hypothetical protein